MEHSRLNTNIISGEELMTVVDVGWLFKVSPQVVRDWCRRGVIPSVKVGRRWYVPKARLEEQLAHDMKQAL